VVEAMRALGLRSRASEVPAAALSALPFPFFAVLASPPPGAADAGNPVASAMVLVLGIDAGAIRYQAPEAAVSITIGLDDFARSFTGTVLLFVLEAAPVGDSDAAAEAAPMFGFRWFIPELLKHRSIWRDVLLASLAMQLMALATPIFTQVVIDKVIVHHTASTLVVIGVALGIFVLFTAVMGWVRQRHRA